MTQLLQQALEAIRNLPDSEQDAIAAIILAEIEDERRWDSAFAQSQDKLASLANRAREEIRTGRVREVGIDEL
jgi:hypothetical protein